MLNLRLENGTLTREAIAIRDAKYELGFQHDNCKSFIPMEETYDAFHNDKCPVCGEGGREAGHFKWVWYSKKEQRIIKDEEIEYG